MKAFLFLFAEEAGTYVTATDPEPAISSRRSDNDIETRLEIGMRPLMRLFIERLI